jgi:hypothetical protein
MIDSLDQDIKKELGKNPYGFSLSDKINYECYGLPCACLSCRHENGFCLDHDQDPCSICGGTLEEIATEFCLPESTS